jgi:hypothetical protein
MRRDVEMFHCTRVTPFSRPPSFSSQLFPLLRISGVEAGESQSTGDEVEVSPTPRATSLPPFKGPAEMGQWNSERKGMYRTCVYRLHGRHFHD